MSGKYVNKKKTNKKNRIVIIVILLILILAAEAALIHFVLNRDQGDHPDPVPSTEPKQSEEDQTPSQTDDVQVPEDTVAIEAVEDVQINLGYGLEITDVGSYTGVYMEDGTDEIVSGVLMIVVTNNSDTALQYAEISLAAGSDTANFALSTLPAGESVVVLEKSRMAYDETCDYLTATAQNVAMYQGALSLCEEQLKIQSLDGALNITNISDEDITEDIVVYYKNSAADMLYGGITYRVRITGGLPAGEIRQIIAEHYSSVGSRVMFVTCD